MVVAFINSRGYLLTSHHFFTLSFQLSLGLTIIFCGVNTVLKVTVSSAFIYRILSEIEIVPTWLWLTTLNQGIT